MSNPTRTPGSVEQGVALVADELLPRVYAELQSLARGKMAREQPGQTLQPTALVHEAWLRLGAGARLFNAWLGRSGARGYATSMRLLLENLPPSLAPQRETLARCLEAMHGALPLREVWLFGSHARGEARPDSDVDLCLVPEGAEQQLIAAQQFRRAIRPLNGKPSFTLMPIAPARLAEKKAIDDFFFGTVKEEGVLLATQD